jgi:hypothetical protein
VIARIPAPLVLGGLLLLLLPTYFLDYGTGRRLALGLPELFGVAHVAFFYGVALLLLRLRPFRVLTPGPRALAVTGAALAAGGAIELLQPLAGRSASLDDLARDGAGAAVAVLLHGRLARRRFALPASAALLTLVLGGAALALLDRTLAALAFPELGGFEQPLEAGRWHPGRITTDRAREGRASLRLDLRPGPYPGASRKRSFGDWRGYGRIELALHNGSDRPQRLAVSIADAAHDGRFGDRYDGTFVLAPGWNTVAVPLREVVCVPSGRRQDPGRIVRLLFFVRDLREPLVLHLDAVRLAGTPVPGFDAPCPAPASPAGPRLAPRRGPGHPVAPETGSPTGAP